MRNNTQIHVMSETIVYETVDYAWFNLDVANRMIIPGKVAKMVEEIKEKNFLPYSPINVTDEGTVMDGQHRLTAAIELNLPIFYILVQNMTILDVASLNRMTDQWTSADYLHYWKERGVEDYNELNMFMGDWPMIPLAAALLLPLPTKGFTYGIYKMFRSGTYQFVDSQQAYDIAALASSFQDRYSLWNRKSFMIGLRRLYTHPKFDVDQMEMQRDRVPGTMFYHVGTTRDATLMLQKIYNYKKQQRVAFIIE